MSAHVVFYLLILATCASYVLGRLDQSKLTREKVGDCMIGGPEPHWWIRAIADARKRKAERESKQ